MKLEEKVFQFLIGRLKTLLISERKTICKRFQFLIGRLKTIRITVIAMLSIRVSIPYR